MASDPRYLVIVLTALDESVGGYAIFGRDENIVHIGSAGTSTAELKALATQYAPLTGISVLGGNADTPFARELVAALAGSEFVVTPKRKRKMILDQWRQPTW